MFSHPSSIIGARVFANSIRPALYRRISSTRPILSSSSDDDKVTPTSDEGSSKSSSPSHSPISDSSHNPSNVPKGGFLKAMAKLEGHENFPRAIKHSPLVQMGDPQGKIAEGTIVHIVDDDLYIDFGAKFNCVCPRPYKNGSVYTLGKRVRVMIHDLELSTRFLGAESDLTILEADCSLLGLARREREYRQQEQ